MRAFPRRRTRKNAARKRKGATTAGGCTCARSRSGRAMASSSVAAGTRWAAGGALGTAGARGLADDEYPQGEYDVDCVPWRPEFYLGQISEDRRERRRA